MELQDFISSALQQIIKGVKDAQEKTAVDGGHVNPVGLRGLHDQLGGRRYNPTDFSVTEIVDFDIAVTAAEGKSSKESVGVVVLSAIGLGRQNLSETKSNVVSRIRFSVPVMLPAGKNFKEGEKLPTGPRAGVPRRMKAWVEGS